VFFLPGNNKVANVKMKMQEGVAPTYWPDGGSKVSPSFGLLDVAKIRTPTYCKKDLVNYVLQDLSRP